MDKAGRAGVPNPKSQLVDLALRINQTHFMRDEFLNKRVSAFLIVLMLICLRHQDVRADRTTGSIKTEHRTDQIRSASAGVRFESPLQFLWDNVSRPIVTRVTRNLISHSIDMPRHARMSRSVRPLRSLEFAGGDRILGEIIDGSDDFVQVRLTCELELKVPRENVRSIAVPHREIEILYEDFESLTSFAKLNELTAGDLQSITNDSADQTNHSLKVSSRTSPRRLVLPVPIDNPRIQFWFFMGNADSSVTRFQILPPKEEGRGLSHGAPSSPFTETMLRSTHSGQIRFLFQSGDEENRFDLDVTSSTISVADSTRSATRLTTQPIHLADGWHCLTAIFSNDRTLIDVDSSLSAAGSPVKSTFRGVEFVVQTDLDSNNKTQSTLLIDHVIVSKLQAPVQQDNKTEWSIN
ncbi:MAG: hypothetical protein FJ267_05565, partial [Planctomycetes bacterium]|nr:hypothetical protein [Planctomycetota bacterium]